MPQWLIIIFIIIGIFLILGLVITIIKGIFGLTAGIFSSIALVFITIYDIISWPIRKIIKIATRKKREAKAKAELEQYREGLELSNKENKENNDENNHSM